MTSNVPDTESVVVPSPSSTAHEIVTVVGPSYGGVCPGNTPGTVVSNVVESELPNWRSVKVIWVWPKMPVAEAPVPRGSQHPLCTEGSSGASKLTVAVNVVFGSPVGGVITSVLAAPAGEAHRRARLPRTTDTPSACQARRTALASLRR